MGWLRISEPISIIATVAQQPFCRWQAAQQGRSASIVADLACGHEEADWATIFINDSM